MGGEGGTKSATEQDESTGTIELWQWWNFVRPTTLDGHPYNVTASILMT